MQRLWLAVALLVTVVACGAPKPAAPYWSSEATTDAQVFEVLRQAGKVEACALIPRAELADLGTPGPDRLHQTAGCRVNLQRPDGTGTLFLQVVAGVFDGAWGYVPEGNRPVTIGGASVVTVEDRATTRDGRVPDGERWCRVDVKYPASAGYQLNLRLPAGSDSPCPAAERLARAAMDRWVEQPPHGTTPGLPRSILAGIDPCAVPKSLGAAIDAREQQLGACSFTLDGTHSGVIFDYFPVDSFVGGRRDDRGRYVLPEGYALMKGQLGPAFADSENGRLAPAVIVPDDTPTSHRVMNAVLDYFA